MDSIMTRTALEIVAYLRSYGVDISFDGEHGRLSNVKDPSILTPELLADMQQLRWEIINVLPWKKDGRLICGAIRLGAHTEAPSYDPDLGYNVCDICWPQRFRPRKLTADDLF